jgi:hypothetical protein
MPEECLNPVMGIRWTIAISQSLPGNRRASLHRRSDRIPCAREPRRRSRAGTIGEIALRAVGYQLGSDRICLRLSGRRGRYHGQASCCKGQACDNSAVRWHGITFFLVRYRRIIAFHQLETNNIFQHNHVDKHRKLLKAIRSGYKPPEKSVAPSANSPAAYAALFALWNRVRWG